MESGYKPTPRHTDAGSLAGNDCSIRSSMTASRAHRRRLLMTAVATAVIAPVASAAATGTRKRLRRPNADSSNSPGTIKPSHSRGCIAGARRAGLCGARRTVRLSGASGSTTTERSSLTVHLYFFAIDDDIRGCRTRRACKCHPILAGSLPYNPARRVAVPLHGSPATGGRCGSMRRMSAICVSSRPTS